MKGCSMASIVSCKILVSVIWERPWEWGQCGGGGSWKMIRRRPVFQLLLLLIVLAFLFSWRTHSNISSDEFHSNMLTDQEDPDVDAILHFQNASSPHHLSQLSSFLMKHPWHRRFFLIWTTQPLTFHDRHFAVLDLIFIHHPGAQVLIFATHLPLNFFNYSKHGYKLHVLRLNSDCLRALQLYSGPASKRWVMAMGDGEEVVGINGLESRWKHVHLSDYLRFALLYRFGGTYLDFDALWIQPQPPMMEFVGLDFTHELEDRSWAIPLDQLSSEWFISGRKGVDLSSDRLYAAPGVMRLKPKRAVMFELMERAITEYNPDCFNCIGVRSLTRFIVQHGDILVTESVSQLKCRQKIAKITTSFWLFMIRNTWTCCRHKFFTLLGGKMRRDSSFAPPMTPAKLLRTWWNMAHGIFIFTVKSPPKSPSNAILFCFGYFNDFNLDCMEAVGQ